MRRLREKLHSQSGASILLALLLFLACCMVAASILAAAASNAGKVRSSRVEQQKHLTLSSAIELVAGEIKEATYTGNYTVYEWPVPIWGKDEEGKPEIVGYDYYFFVKQTEGEFTCGELTDLLPLRDELDWMFGKQFSGSGYKARLDKEPSSAPRSLTVTLPADLDGYPYIKDPDNPTAYEVSDTVTVQVELNHSTRHITLTAWLGGGDAPPADGSDTMCAELVAGDAPVLNYAPGGRLPGSGSSGTGVGKSTATVKWQLNWIKKGAG